MSQHVTHSTDKRNLVSIAIDEIHSSKNQVSASRADFSVGRAMESASRYCENVCSNGNNTDK